MILKKLQEALDEIASQRAALDDVEAQLRGMIARMTDQPTISGVAPQYPDPIHLAHSAAAPSVGSNEKDTLDHVADVLRVEGKPLHISIIAERLSDRLGRKVVRTQIEPGLNRHVSKAKARRIEKFAPSTFGLPEWKISRDSHLSDVA